MTRPTIIRGSSGIERPSLGFSINGHSGGNFAFDSQTSLFPHVRIRLYSVASQIVVSFGCSDYECGNPTMRGAISSSIHWRPSLLRRDIPTPRCGFTVMGNPEKLWAHFFECRRPSDDVARVFNLPLSDGRRYSGKEGAYLDIALTLWERDGNPIVGAEVFKDDRPKNILWEWCDDDSKFWHLHRVRIHDLLHVWKKKETTESEEPDLIVFLADNSYVTAQQSIKSYAGGPAEWRTTKGVVRIEGEQLHMSSSVDAVFSLRDGKAKFVAAPSFRRFVNSETAKCQKIEGGDIVIQGTRYKKARFEPPVWEDFKEEPYEREERESILAMLDALSRLRLAPGS